MILTEDSFSVGEDLAEDLFGFGVPALGRDRSEVCAEGFDSAAGCPASVDTGIGGDQRDVEGFG